MAKKYKAYESYLDAMRPLVREKEMNWNFLWSKTDEQPFLERDAI